MKRLKIAISFALISIVIISVFSPSLKNGFTNWDDNGYVTENNIIKSFSWKSVGKIFTSFSMDSYQPIAILSYLFEYHFFKLNPLGYHATNLILHLFNCLFVFWLVFLLSGKVRVSLITTILFGIYPLQVESVAWISERKGLLSAFFALGAIICYFYYLQKGQRLRYYYLSLLFFILSLLSKATAVTLPLLLFLLDYLLYRKLNKTMLYDKIPFFILSFVFVIIGLFAHYLGPEVKAQGASILLNKIIIASYSIIFYLNKILMPVNLSCLYRYPGRIDYFLLVYPIAVAILFIAVFFSGRHTRKIIFGSAFFLIGILPSLQFIEVGKSIVADRYVYFSSIGIFYIAGELFIWLYRKKIRYGSPLKILLIIALFIIIGAISFLTYRRTKVWENSITLWNDVLSKYPNALAYTNRGVAYYYKGELNQAIRDYAKAIQINPNCAEPYISRGVAYYYKGELNQAIRDYAKAIQINPRLADAYFNLGIAYGNKNILEQAISNFSKTVQINPNYHEAYYNRGLAYYCKGNYGRAISDCAKAIQINPEYIEAYVTRAAAYFYKHNYERAWEDVHRIEAFGVKVNAEFLEALKEMSRREK